MHELEKDLKEIEATLSQIALTYPKIARDAAQARFAYDIAYAEMIETIDHRALANGEKRPTRDAVANEATLAVKDVMLTARLAEAELDISQRLMKNLESRLSSTQSRAKLYLIEAGVTK